MLRCIGVGRPPVRVDRQSGRFEEEGIIMQPTSNSRDFRIGQSAHLGGIPLVPLHCILLWLPGCDHRPRDDRTMHRCLLAAVPYGTSALLLTEPSPRAVSAARARPPRA